MQLCACAVCIHKLHGLIDLSCTVRYLYNTIAVYVHPLEHVYMLTLFTIVNSVLLLSIAYKFHKNLAIYVCTCMILVCTYVNEACHLLLNVY